MKNTFYTEPIIQEESSKLISINNLSKPDIKNNLKGEDKRSKISIRKKKKIDRLNDSYGIFLLNISLVNIVSQSVNWEKRNSNYDRAQINYESKTIDNKHLNSVAHSDHFLGKMHC